MNVQSSGSRFVRSQRGAAALVVTMGLFFAMVLVAAYVNRNLVFEQRIAANQYRSTQAFEAAEAGVEWAITQLDRNRRVGLDCLPTEASSALSFRSRFLRFNRLDGSFTPQARVDGPSSAALSPACVRSTAGWSCSCPPHDAAAAHPAERDDASVAFTLQFLPTRKPGTVRISSTGCTRSTGDCLADAKSSAGDANAKVDVAIGLLAGLRTPPVAALTTRAAFDADSADLSVSNTDPATSVAIHAGARISAGHAHVTTAAGASASGALIADDDSLAAMSTDRFFASHFGLDKIAWKRQPEVTIVECSADCDEALTTAAASAADSALIWIEGDLALRGPLTLGSKQRPVVIVASGAIRLDGAVAITGVIYGAAIRWNNTGAAGFVRGAALSESTYQGTGSPRFDYDAAVLAALASHSGSFARVSGSWRDF
jgi:hypothetical protein